MEKWASKIIWLLGSLSTIGIVAMQTSVEDAKSNLAGWLELIPNYSVPSIIQNKNVDIYGTIICAIILSITLIVWLYKRNVSLKGSISPQRQASISRSRVTFDYSTNNGVVTVGKGPKEFRIAFSGASSSSIHIYSSSHKSGSNCIRIARIKKDDKARLFSELDSSSSSYTISITERFMAENPNGYYITAKIISIKYDGWQADKDEVIFAYRIGRSKGDETIRLS